LHISALLGVCVRVVNEMTHLAFQVIAAGGGHVLAVIERLLPALRDAVFFPIVENRQRRRGRSDFISVLPLAQAGVQDALLRGREPVKGHQALVLARQLGPLHLPPL
jgi:hypothetical protein